MKNKALILAALLIIIACIATAMEAKESFVTEGQNTTVRGMYFLIKLNDDTNDSSSVFYFSMDDSDRLNIDNIQSANPEIPSQAGQNKTIWKIDFINEIILVGYWSDKVSENKENGASMQSGAKLSSGSIIDKLRSTNINISFLNTALPLKYIGNLLEALFKLIIILLALYLTYMFYTRMNIRSAVKRWDRWYRL